MPLLCSLQSALRGVTAVVTVLALSGCQTPSQPQAKPVPASKAAAAGKAAKSKLSLLQDPERVVYHEKAIEPVGDSIRVAAYNIQDFTDAVNDGYMRTPAVMHRQVAAAARNVNEIQPDLLFVEEIENAEVLKVFNEQLDPPFPIAYISNFNEKHRGTKRNIALLSRVKLLKIREIDFAAADAPVHLARGTLAVAVDLGDDSLLLAYGVHLKSNFGKAEGKGAANIQKRQEGLKLVRAHAELVVEANPGKTWEIVVIGDMNVDPDLPDFADDASLEPMSDWVDLWRGRPLEERVTIPTRFGDPDLQFPSACFDRIIVSPDLKQAPWQTSEAKVLQRGVDTENVFTAAGQNDLHASDHYPVYVDIQK